MMKALTRLSLSLLGISLLAGCGKDMEHSKVHDTGFVYCGLGDPSTFNPQLIDRGITSEALSPQIFDTLLTLDAHTHQPIPSIAESWTLSEDGKEYTFSLKPNVYFQRTEWFNPTRPLNADDVIFSFERIIDPEHEFHAVGGGFYPWFAGINFGSQVERIEKVNDLTVRFVLTQPNLAFLSNIATSHAVIHSQEYASLLAFRDAKHEMDLKPVGSGPFLLREFRSNDAVRLVRHENYWGTIAKMEQVVFDVSQRGTGTLAKLLRDECDALSSPVLSQVPVIERADFLKLEATSPNNVSFIAINTSSEALSDVRVRQALNLAINRQNILDAVYFGQGQQAYTLLPSSSWAYQKDSVKIRYDQDYALALLKEAGYEHGLSLRMWVPLETRAYNPSPRKTAEIIQANLAEVGVKVTLLTDDRFERVELTQMNNVDLLLSGWIGDTGDPDNFLRPLLSCDSERVGLNVSMWCHDDFDFLLDLALETQEQRYRLNLYKQAQNILNEEFPIIPLAHGAQFRVYNKSLTGFTASPFGAQPFNNVKRVN